MMQKLLITSIVTASLLVRCVLAQSCSLDPKGEATKVDVLILGAGMAGIAAARTLEVNEIDDFVVLEATDRIGGRIREDDGNPNLLLGAHWIQEIDLNDPKHHPIWREWVQCDENGPIGSPTPDITLMYNQSGDEIDISEYQKTAVKFEEACEAAEEIGMSRSIRGYFPEAGSDHGRLVTQYNTG